MLIFGKTGGQGESFKEQPGKDEGSHQLEGCYFAGSPCTQSGQGNSTVKWKISLC